jgi:3-oxoacyl-[acyl-carrier protein] reductase
MKPSDLRVIVTGAAGGLGSYFCTALAEAGAQVAAFDVQRDGLARLARDTGGLAGKLHPYEVDVARPADVAECVEQAARDMGGLNALINNAGIARDGHLVKVDDRRSDILKMPREQWQKVIDIDLTAPFFLAREVAAHLIEHGVRPGLIVNITSISRHGIVGQANYSAAKAGLTVSTRVWAQELASFGIRVAAIAPGFIRTSFVSAMDPRALEATIGRIPLGRLGEPAEIYAALRFLIECDYFTGRCLDVDGGLGV